MTSSSFSRIRPRRSLPPNHLTLTTLPTDLLSHILSFNLPSPPPYGIPKTRANSLDDSIDLQTNSYKAFTSDFSNLLQPPPNMHSEDLNNFIHNLLDTLLPALTTCSQLHKAAAMLLIPYKPLLLHVIYSNDFTRHGQLLHLAGNIASLLTFQQSCLAAGYPLTMASYLASNNFNTYPDSQTSSNPHTSSCLRHTAILRLLSSSLTHISLFEPRYNSHILCVSQALVRARPRQLQSIQLPIWSHDYPNDATVRRVLTKLFDIAAPSLKELHLVLPCKHTMNVAARMPLPALKKLTIVLRHPTRDIEFCKRDEIDAREWEQMVDDLCTRFLQSLKKCGSKLEELTLFDKWKPYKIRIPRIDVKEVAPTLKKIVYRSLSILDEEAIRMLVGVRRVEWFDGEFDFGKLEKVLEQVQLNELREIGLRECQISFPEIEVKVEDQLKNRVEQMEENRVLLGNTRHVSISAKKEDNSIVGPMLTDVMNAYGYDHVFETNDLRYITNRCTNIRKLQLCICSEAIPSMVSYLYFEKNCQHLTVLDLWADGNVNWWRGSVHAEHASSQLLHAICNKSGAKLMHLRLRGFWISVVEAMDMVKEIGKDLRTLWLSLYEYGFDAHQSVQEMSTYGISPLTINIGDMRKLIELIHRRCRNLRWIVLESIHPPTETELADTSDEEMSEEMRKMKFDLESEFTVRFYTWLFPVLRVSLQRKT